MKDDATSPDPDDATTELRLRDLESRLLRLDSMDLNVDDEPIRFSMGEPGQVLDNKYRLVRRIGGGLSDVFLAEQLNMENKPVVVKLVVAASPLARGRFDREIKILARLSHDRHPNIVWTIDRGRVDDTHFLVTEYIDGVSLQDKLRSNSDLTMRDIKNIAAGVAKGLQFAHDQGVVHRDVKLANVMIAVDGTAKVIDFGVSTLCSADVPQECHGIISGTSSYMSPEQRAGKETGPATDIYSLGVMLRKMLSVSGLDKDGTDSVPMRRILAKMTAELPEDRYRSMNDFVADLSSIPDRRSRRFARTGIWAGATFIAFLLGVTANAIRLNDQAMLDSDRQRVAAAVESQPQRLPTKGQMVAIARIQQLGGFCVKQGDDVIDVDLSYTEVTDSDLELLNVFPKLLGVFLNNTKVTVEGLMKLPPTVFRIDLDSVPFSDGDCHRLSQRDFSEIAFQGAEITDLGVESLVSIPSLTSISISQCQVSDAVIDVLLRQPMLKTIVVNRNPLSSRSLVKLTALKHLEYLHMSETEVDDAAVASFVASCPLRELGLTGCRQITDESLRLLADCVTLESLFLDECEITLAGLRHLIDHPRLERVYLRSNPALEIAEVENIFSNRISVISSW